MSTSRLRRRAAVPAAIASGVALSLGLVAGPAVGQISSPPLVAQVSIGDTATLVARGAAVSVPVQAACTELDGIPGHAWLSVQATARVGSSIAQGYGSAEFACSGLDSLDVTEVLVTAEGFTDAFKKAKSAVVEANLYVDYSTNDEWYGDTSTSTYREIPITTENTKTDKPSKTDKGSTTEYSSRIRLTSTLDPVQESQIAWAELPGGEQQVTLSLEPVDDRHYRSLDTSGDVLADMGCYIKTAEANVPTSTLWDSLINATKPKSPVGVWFPTTDGPQTIDVPAGDPGIYVDCWGEGYLTTEWDFTITTDSATPPAGDWVTFADGVEVL